MNKKCCSVVSTLLFVCCVFTGCGGGGSNNDSDMIQRNIYKEDYDEQYNHYEDKVYVAKKCSKITVVRSATITTQSVECFFSNSIVSLKESSIV